MAHSSLADNKTTISFLEKKVSKSALQASKSFSLKNSSR